MFHLVRHSKIALDLNAKDKTRPEPKIFFLLKVKTS